jgi:hypothetical protein
VKVLRLEAQKSFKAGSVGVWRVYGGSMEGERYLRSWLEAVLRDENMILLEALCASAAALF